MFKIKLSIVVLSVVCMLSNKANAQKPPTAIGIKTGANFATFNASVTKPVIDHLSQEPWLYAGLEAQIGLAKNLSIQPELFWVSNRQQVYLNSPSAIREEDLNQLSLPILVKYHVGKVAFCAGPQIDFLLSAKEKNLDVKDSYKKTSFNGAVGAEWVFKYRFGVDIRYVFGLTNMAAPNAKSDITSQPNQNLKINSLQAGLFFRFAKKPEK